MANKKIINYSLVNKTINTAVQMLWKKSPKMCWYVFGTPEDACQAAWLKLWSSEGSIAATSNITENNAGLVCVIAHRGLIDYVRQILGKNSKGAKYDVFRKTMLYMDLNTYATVSDTIDSITGMSNITNATEESYIKANLQKEIDTYFTRKLNKRNKQIIDLVYKKGFTLHEVGKHFSITESRASQIVKQALTGARKRYEQKA